MTREYTSTIHMFTCTYNYCILGSTKDILLGVILAPRFGFVSSLIGSLRNEIPTVNAELEAYVDQNGTRGQEALPLPKWCLPRMEAKDFEFVWMLRQLKIMQGWHLKCLIIGSSQVLAQADLIRASRHYTY